MSDSDFNNKRVDNALVYELVMSLAWLRLWVWGNLSGWSQHPAAWSPSTQKYRDDALDSACNRADQAIWAYLRQDETNERR